MADPRGVATQHTTHYEAAMHRLTQASREATPSNDKEAPSDDAAHLGQDGVRSGNKRCKQNPVGTVTIASHDEDHGWEVGCFGMGCISATTHSGRHSARTPRDYIKRLIEEACPNHTYPIRDKIKDCGMLQSFMTSGSPTWGAKPQQFFRDAP
jgi:hypothetical protein